MMTPWYIIEWGGSQNRDLGDRKIKYTYSIGGSQNFEGKISPIVYSPPPVPKKLCQTIKMIKS